MSKKILVIDDEVDIVQMIKLRLEHSGYEVSVSYDGKDGLEKVKSEKPDLIISDVMMPSLNGFQLCRMIKDDASLKSTFVILLTAKTTQSDQFWGEEAGADCYMTKPYNADELLEKIKELLNRT